MANLPPPPAELRYFLQSGRAPSDWQSCAQSSQLSDSLLTTASQLSRRYDVPAFAQTPVFGQCSRTANATPDPCVSSPCNGPKKVVVQQTVHAKLGTQGDFQELCEKVKQLEHERDLLRGTVMDLRDERNMLRERVRSFENNHQKTRAELESTTTLQEKLFVATSSLRQKLAHLENERELRPDVKDLEESLRLAQEREGELERIVALQQDISAVHEWECQQQSQQRAAYYEQKIKELDESRLSEQHKHATLERDAKSLRDLHQENVEQLQYERGIHQQSIQDLKNHSAAQQEKILVLEESLARSQAKRTDVERTVALQGNLCAATRALSQRFHQLEADREQNMHMDQQYAQKVDELEERLAICQARRSELERAVVFQASLAGTARSICQKLHHLENDRDVHEDLAISQKMLETLERIVAVQRDLSVCNDATMQNPLSMKSRPLQTDHKGLKQVVGHENINEFADMSCNGDAQPGLLPFEFQSGMYHCGPPPLRDPMLHAPEMLPVVIGSHALQSFFDYLEDGTFTPKLVSNFHIPVGGSN